MFSLYNINSIFSYIFISGLIFCNSKIANADDQNKAIVKYIQFGGAELSELYTKGQILHLDYTLLNFFFTIEELRGTLVILLTVFSSGLIKKCQ